MRNIHTIDYVKISIQVLCVILIIALLTSVFKNTKSSEEIISAQEKTIKALELSKVAGDKALKEQDEKLIAIQGKDSALKVLDFYLLKRYYDAKENEKSSAYNTPIKSKLRREISEY